MVRLIKGNQEYGVSESSSLFKELKEKGFLVEGEELEVDETEIAVAALNGRIKVLDDENTALKKEVTKLEKENKELKEKTGAVNGTPPEK